MKKHQAIAMALSALSAGILISCAKPGEEAANNESTPTKSEVSTPNATDSTSAAPPSTTATTSSEALTPVTISAQAQKTYLKHIADELIIPAYHDAVVQSHLLHTLAQQHCATGSVQGDKLQELRGQWIKLAQAWASAEMINFGPATQSMSNLYINYYPDERGLVHDGVAELILANPNLTPEQLAQESAIVQGVPGLEEALYADDRLTEGQCAYVISASAALNQRLTQIEKTWQKEAASLLAMDSVERSDQGLNLWMNALLSFIETMKTSAIDQPLGLSGKAKGHVPAATAGQSRAIINAKLATLNKAFTDPVLTAMLQGEAAAVGDHLAAKLAETSTLLAQMPTDITQADPKMQQQLLTNLTAITQIIKRELIPTLGVRVGFNSTDGD